MYALCNGVFRSSALGVYLASDGNESKVVIHIVRMDGTKFPNKRPWGAPMDGRYYGKSRYD